MLTGNAESTWCDLGKMRRQKNGVPTATTEWRTPPLLSRGSGSIDSEAFSPQLETEVFHPFSFLSFVYFSIVHPSRCIRRSIYSFARWKMSSSF
jgi:hypothetical protein